jgi:hypothetical protein
MPPPPPVIHDATVWRAQLLEHRRALFERLIQEFPDLLKSKRTQVDHWRFLLSGPKKTS